MAGLADGLCCCGVALRSTGLEVGAVWVGAGAWPDLLPRLPPPPAARASAGDGASEGTAMIRAARIASQRNLVIWTSLLNRVRPGPFCTQYVRALCLQFKGNRASGPVVCKSMHMRILAVALAFWPGFAAAEGCLDQVRELAKSQNISTDPPTASPDRASPKGPLPTRPPGVTSRELGRSGGVIEPPATSDRSVITPPGTTDSRMPTMPDVTRTPGPPPTQEAARDEAKKERAADRTALQALLVAARAEAERGQEANCVDTLKKARELLERAEK